ncbi:regulator [Vibrio sp. S4M6]|uniref:regulator n=1 Tax=Vibrio sinus TaxID=2946865 RepID=UPI002029B983|nr:regulator [Vibrio sinus]MCL9783241.1 regulator [Vibrio sinus]
MKYNEMTKNYVFRKFECGLTKQQTAELCFKSLRTVYLWDSGKTIPEECKRLMRMSRGRELSPTEDWEQFRMHYDKLELPTGQLVSPQEILCGIALAQINSELEIKISTKLLKLAREIARIKVQQSTKRSS